MITTFTIVRYSKIAVPFAILSMAILHIPLFFQKGLRFYKLLGSGKNGTFDVNPDWQQWGFIGVWESRESYDFFMQNSGVSKWWRLLTQNQWTLVCKVISSHGTWDGKSPFIAETIPNAYDGMVVVLTRASIRPLKALAFWQNVPDVAKSMENASGLVASMGVGEMPFFKQATLSIWKSAEDIKQFAYRQKQHAEVIKKTRTQKWYREELFARFIPIESIGYLNEKEIKII